MKNSKKFIKKISHGELCLGTAITTSDPSVTEAVAPDLDLVWIDTEHTSMSLEAVKGHLMATEQTDCASLVRVPWNDPVLIKPILDIGADGIIVPMVSTAEEAAKAVAACKYPPEGNRGFGPLRPLNYGRLDAAQFVQDANENIIVIVQIEQKEAVANIDEILAVPGLTSLAIGPQDLSASFGVRTQPRHPDVLAAIETVIGKARDVNIPVGVSVGSEPNALCAWADMGFQWISFGVDVMLMIQAAREIVDKVRTHVGK